MRHRTLTLMLAALCLAALPALAGEGDAQTVKGELVDMACYVAHGDSGAGDDHADCAKRCVESGQPLGLYTEAGDLYVLFADHKDSAPFEEAKAHAGETVEITGAVSERGGVKGMTVHAVHAG